MILDLLDPASDLSIMMPDEYPDDLSFFEFIALAQTIADLHPLAAIALYDFLLPFSIACA